MKQNPRYVAIWLLTVSLMIYVLIAIGGFTRLTDSGLSMVDWQPITGIIPPLTQDDWFAEFERYQQYPEYKFVNSDMSLKEFKQIFWVEYLHRIIGRLVAAFFFFPFLYFSIRGYFTRTVTFKLIFVFLLGGLQGLLGWYMVKSGLVDNPAVSQYRLTAHLGLAVVLYGYVLWMALQFFEFRAVVHHYHSSVVHKFSIVCIALVAFMLVSGGLMAGTRAGFVINTFPDMNGQWWPDMIFALSPTWKNFFENVVTIQFMHRWAAILSLIAIIGLWTHRFRIEGFHVRLVLDLILVAILLQICLGILTLLTRVDLAIALAHQSVFVLLLSLLIVLLKITSAPRKLTSVRV